MIPRQQRHRSRSKRHRSVRDGGILRGEFDANLRRFDDRMNRMFAKSDERMAQHRREIDEQFTKETERGIAGSDRHLASLLKSMEERSAADAERFQQTMNARFRDMDKRIDDMKQLFAALREDLAETRKDMKLLRWHIWIAACTTVLGVAGAMSATNSMIISTFESGRSASVATVRNASTPGTLPTPAKMKDLSPVFAPNPASSVDVSTHTPLHRREDSEDTLEDNRSQS